MKQGDYVLLAWSTYEPSGGLNDCRGWFLTPKAALDFWKHSEDCEHLDEYQIIDTESWEIVNEGSR